MTRLANAHTHTRHPANATARRRVILSKDASTEALAIASSATQASITTTVAVERKPSLVMGAPYPRGR